VLVLGLGKRRPPRPEWCFEELLIVVTFYGISHIQVCCCDVARYEATRYKIQE
jgi:hypothetical protein